ncbi:MAG TPA: GNAT family N-acetyltransferase [Anaerolineae bacterium]|nr:GNAT family N-acetyltransferase [Anaerolineae bacterium]
MFIRSAFRADLRDCLSLDSSYETSHVWQLDQRDDDAGITVALRRVRLPRPMPVRYPSQEWDLLRRWDQGGGVFVAEVGGKLQGFLDASLQGDEKLCWIHNLVVDPPFRRRGLASALVEEAIRWGHQRSLRRVMLAVQSKNDPAIEFWQRCGFSFCGFSDRYFANRDIALFFAGRVS